jgi:peptidoglycan-associated lipoprotein
MYRRLIWIAPAAAARPVAHRLRQEGPQTAADLSVETETVADVTPTPRPEPAPPAPAADDLYAMDIDSLNRYVREKGLLADVYFDFDRSELRTDAAERLSRNAAFLAEHPSFVVVVEGHADERGTNEYNLALGQDRASSTRRYLGSLGVSGQRLDVVSYGEERPECTDPGEDCWWKNRRAHFRITGRSSDAG